MAGTLNESEGLDDPVGISTGDALFVDDVGCAEYLLDRKRQEAGGEFEKRQWCRLRDSNT
ncbi:hypothetical protein P8Q88_05510 [Qipengyuania sp. XHP0207]|uniref:hypothetical protein n=1 Tax=Qipengyuania sp. XHP0207 TaxID=3038078 RepID=UPI00241E8230|nr:hypothetical protein [Qipengyuania sp. XHP0207]MDG5747633.1 hypothetical protein [Qipengyuania sp. XHP0207]